MKETTKALVLTAKMGTKVVEALTDDGRIDFSEGIDLGMTSLKFIGVFKSIKEIKEELKGYNEEKKNALVSAFKTEFDLPDDEVEFKVETGLEFLLNLYLYIHGEKAAAEVTLLKTQVKAA
jgi:hypothetical protein